MVVMPFVIPLLFSIFTVSLLSCLAVSTRKVPSVVLRNSGG